DAMSPGTNLAGHPVLGRFEQWRECAAEGKFIRAIMKTREAQTRFTRIRSLAIPCDRWATVMDPTAIVASDASVGCGSFVGAGVNRRAGGRGRRPLPSSCKLLFEPRCEARRFRFCGAACHRLGPLHDRGRRTFSAQIRSVEMGS